MTDAARLEVLWNVVKRRMKSYLDDSDRYHEASCALANIADYIEPKCDHCGYPTTAHPPSWYRLGRNQGPQCGTYMDEIVEIALARRKKAAETEKVT
jgi:hypothetical protein